MIKPDNGISALFGYARIEVSRGSCYGSPALTIDIKFESDGAVTADFLYCFKKKTVALEAAEANDFLMEISNIIEKPEVSADLRHVEVRYHTAVEWRNFPFIKNESAGEFKAFSNEWSIDEIEEFIKFEAKTPEIAERFQKILDRKPHRHALEIYRAAHKFARKFAGYMFAVG